MSNEKELLEEELEEMTEKEAENTAEPQEEAKAEASEQQPELTNEEKLEKELSEMKDKYLRLMAEYDNYRKRTAKQLLENTQTAKSNTHKIGLLEISFCATGKLSHPSKVFLSAFSWKKRKTVAAKPC